MSEHDQGGKSYRQQQNAPAQTRQHQIEHPSVADDISLEGLQGPVSDVDSGGAGSIPNVDAASWEVFGVCFDDYADTFSPMSEMASDAMDSSALASEEPYANGADGPEAMRRSNVYSNEDLDVIKSLTPDSSREEMIEALHGTQGPVGDFSEGVALGEYAESDSWSTLTGQLVGGLFNPSTDVTDLGAAFDGGSGSDKVFAMAGVFAVGDVAKFIRKGGAKLWDDLYGAAVSTAKASDFNLGVFRGAKLHGGFVIEEVTEATDEMVDVLGRPAVASTSSVGQTMKITLEAGLSPSEASISMYH